MFVRAPEAGAGDAALVGKGPRGWSRFCPSGCGVWRDGTETGGRRRLWRLRFASRQGREDRGVLSQRNNGGGSLFKKKRETGEGNRESGTAAKGSRV